MFSKHTGQKDSNEAEILAILEALRSYSGRFLEDLIGESDFLNDISWVDYRKGPWRFQFILNEIKSLSSSISVTFSYVSRLANFMANALAKQGVVRILALEASLI